MNNIHRMLLLTFSVLLMFMLVGCGGEEEADIENEKQEEETVSDPQEEERIREEREEEKEEETYFISVSEGSTLRMRKTPGTKDKPEDDIIAELKRNEEVVIKNKHDDSEKEDGFIWWEIYDPSEEDSGWVAKEYLSPEKSAEDPDYEKIEAKLYELESDDVELTTESEAREKSLEDYDDSKENLVWKKESQNDDMVRVYLGPPHSEYFYYYDLKWIDNAWKKEAMEKVEFDEMP